MILQLRETVQKPSVQLNKHMKFCHSYSLVLLSCPVKEIIVKAVNGTKLMFQKDMLPYAQKNFTTPQPAGLVFK